MQHQVKFSSVSKKNMSQTGFECYKRLSNIIEIVKSNLSMQNSFATYGSSKYDLFDSGYKASNHHHHHQYI